MKALFLVGRPGHSTVIMNSFPHDKTFFRFEDEANGDTRQKDDELLRHAVLTKPDVIVYLSAYVGDFVPLNETLGELNAIAPLIHFLCDGQDPPWLPQLKEFERRGVFSLTVNIDGGHQWPGGKDWTASIEGAGTAAGTTGEGIVPAACFGSVGETSGITAGADSTSEETSPPD